MIFRIMVMIIVIIIIGSMLMMMIAIIISMMMIIIIVIISSMMMVSLQGLRARYPPCHHPSANCHVQVLASSIIIAIIVDHQHCHRDPYHSQPLSFFCDHCH